MESRVSILVLVFVLLHCNMLFYRENQPYPLLSYIQDDVFSEILVLWEEKLEHPLSGTTKKRNYKTKMSILSFKIQNEKITEKTILDSFTISKWVLPESVYVISLDPLQVLFLCGEGSEYGTNTKLSYYLKDEIKMTIENVKNVIPSPNKKFIATIETQENKFLGIYSIQEGNIKLFQKVQIPFAFTDERWITWDSQNRNQIYFYENHQVFEFNLDTKEFKKSKIFPECILPSTSFGLNMDTMGRQFFYDSEIKDYRIQKMENFKSFFHKQYITNPSQIQYQCF